MAKQDSPLSREAVEAIIAAPRIPLAHDGTMAKAVHRAVQELGDRIALAASDNDPMTHKDYLAFLAAFERLKTVLFRVYREEKLLGTEYRLYGPPLPSPKWIERVEAWKEKEEARKAHSRGEGPNEWLDAWFYPKALGLFRLAFNVEPKATPGGPAYLFVAAMFEGMTKAPTTMLRKIRQSEPDVDFALGLISKHLDVLREYDPPDSW